ncbi:MULTISPECIES: hypothetical protein [Caproicibacterium]|jgi:hypothetical protein|uniref:Uncharacterized protein n=1 Tax=Caproicibacterium lactatifermentans TaxID=2666138 RepID=A0A859DT74_9FIRM|nr:hypothetical protein [Caproicibacterium lactatifermentans]ARP51175.1 hypothetical protein B6259_09980 [Ruminococcaceae bacterium CPB6]MDD4806982.1 hypothetical protein [Oscillospiraceae bacterium]QKN24675.1 hypothetical protein GJQ69_09425 [Caproicibacterium lactatifermentans]QKO30174.1 hypothetical protein GKP14_03580 [Caproicibacterium lactatifermentans]
MQNRSNRPLSGFPSKVPQKVTPEQVQQLIQQLTPTEKQQLNNVLNSKEATQKLLSTPQAKELMKKFGGGK